MTTVASWWTWTRKLGTEVPRPGPPATVTYFADRAEAGNVLADWVARSRSVDELGRHVAAVVVALPRGGVPVGAGVARRLHAPLVVLPVAKVGAPGQEELAVGAVAAGEVTVLNPEVVGALGLDEAGVARLVAPVAARVADQLGYYQAGGPLPVAGRLAVVVDDGLATGATMRAALIAVRQLRPARLVLAVPVAPPPVLESLSSLVDEEVCPLQPPRMQAVGSWYRDFTQTTDAEVSALLAELRPGPAPVTGERGAGR